MPKVLVVLVLFLSALLLPLPLAAQALLSAAQPMRVYVGALQGTDAELNRTVRARLVDELLARGVALVESEEQADAILTGAYLRQTSHKLNLGGRKGLRFRLEGDLRLTGVDGQLLWSGDLSSDRYSISQTANFVDKAGRQIDHALDLAERRRSTASHPWPPQGR